jgi:hypothetical protein
LLIDELPLPEPVLAEYESAYAIGLIRVEIMFCESQYFLETSLPSTLDLKVSVTGRIEAGYNEFFHRYNFCRN